MKLLLPVGGGCLAGIALLCGLWAYAGTYGMHVLLRHGGTWWVGVSSTSSSLSPAMRLALAADPEASAGPFQWRSIATGFDVADLPVMVSGQPVDHILLARIDPAHYRFIVRNRAAGDRGLDQWIEHLGAALVVNGSYYGHDGKPDTPFLALRHDRDARRSGCRAEVSGRTARTCRQLWSGESAGVCFRDREARATGPSGRSDERSGLSGP